MLAAWPCPLDRLWPDQKLAKSHSFERIILSIFEVSSGIARCEESLQATKLSMSYRDPSQRYRACISSTVRRVTCLYRTKPLAPCAAYRGLCESSSSWNQLQVVGAPRCYQSDRRLASLHFPTLRKDTCVARLLELHHNYINET